MFVSLQECFNCPYGTKYFSEYAENIPGQSSDLLSNAAKQNSVYVVGGEFIKHIYLKVLQHF